MGEAERTAVCLWIAHTYVFDRGFTYTPRLFVTSLKAASGKSQLLRLIAACSDGGKKLEKGPHLPRSATCERTESALRCASISWMAPATSTKTI